MEEYVRLHRKEWKIPNIKVLAKAYQKVTKIADGKRLMKKKLIRITKYLLQ